MSSKFIPYPCDYQNTASVKRAHRRGNILVIVLCCVIALLLCAGTVFALINGGRAWKTAEEVGSRIYIEKFAVGINPVEKQDDKPLPEGDAPEGPGASSDPAAQTDPTKSTDPAAQTDPTKSTDPAAQTDPTKSTDPAAQNDPTKSTDPAAQNDPAAQIEPAPAPAVVKGYESIPDIVDAVAPGVVGILNYEKGKSRNAEPVVKGSGSGFVYREDGYIITNHHVIEGAVKITVSLKDGRSCDATLVGGDIMTDVAVLKIEAENLKALPIGDSSKARVGEFVLAIGDPISADELSGSVTFGIVSALSREINIEGFVNEYLQTDAAVNPGNSGGPLINMRGEVIGVTSAKYTSAGYDSNGQNISSEGIGFALPINNVTEIADSLIQNGSKVRPGIGVTIVTYLEATETVATPGVYIYGVTEGSPAEEAGIRVGDRLVMLDGVEMTQEEFVEAIRAKNVGDTIVMTVERNGELLDLNVVVGDMNQIHK